MGNERTGGRERRVVGGGGMGSGEEEMGVGGRDKR